MTLQESYPDYVDLRDRNRTFDGLAGFSVARVGLDSGENPMPVWTEEATANYFDVLRIRPFLGRFFHASDAHGPDSAPYAVLSDAFWRTHFQSDRGVI
ncbi:MAG: ABC transporter permease, partial [Candidatus Acidiferrales bacterium]